jgi:hypothetical protein
MGARGLIIDMSKACGVYEPVRLVHRVDCIRSKGGQREALLRDNLRTSTSLHTVCVMMTHCLP